MSCAVAWLQTPLPCTDSLLSHLPDADCEVLEYAENVLFCVVGDSDAPQGGPPAGGRYPHPQRQDDWG